MKGLNPWNMLRAEGIRNRIFYTVFFIFLYRLGTFVLLPGIDIESFLAAKNRPGSLLDRMLGTAFDSYSLFSLGISPYITSSIIIQIAGFLIPYFQNLREEGVAGRTRLNQHTRQLALLVALVQSVILMFRLTSAVAIKLEGWQKYFFYFNTVTLLISSTMCCVWLADRITEKGLGNGASVLVMVGIISRFFPALLEEISQPGRTVIFLIGELVVWLAIVLCILIFMHGVRKIPLQYARQTNFMEVSTQLSNQYLPVKLNITGVMPIIFANTLVAFVSALMGWLKNYSEWAQSIAETLSDDTNWKFNALQAVLIFAGSFMYAVVFIHPNKIAEDLKRRNGFIPGIRIGQPTVAYIDTIISRVVFPGAVFLACVAMLPAVFASSGLVISKNFSRFFGGSSMLIIIGVILEIAQQIEGYLYMEHYDSIMGEPESIPEL